ncbi:GIY-YIG nuclease family protein [Undibacterium sp. Ji49W]|uniref:GIY-YIG nuclease family protein n=1 Tax=Undibacterium sp. Ji49W TaxID=3413040 RepID=UPI003BF18334
MNRLLEIGFQMSGHWELDGDKINCELLRHSRQKNILYAFVCDGLVKYVGKTVQPLFARMNGYKTPGKTQSTNIRNNRRIKDLLINGVAVEIFVLPDNGLLHYGQFHLNLAAALEDDLIKVIDPEWNGGATESEIDTPQPSKDGESEIINSALQDISQNIIGSFDFVLQPTYYKTGFFNVRIAVQQQFGGDGEVIEIFLGDSLLPVLGSINRKANLNNTPRIMGGAAVRDWFISNTDEMSIIRLDVFSPTSIRLRS